MLSFHGTAVGSAPLRPEGEPQVARCLAALGPAEPIDQDVLGDLDLQRAFDQFPSEDTLATIAHPIDPLGADSLRAQFDLALAVFPSEGRFADHLAADTVVAHPSTADRSGRGAGARARLSSAWQGAILRVAGLQTAVGPFAIKMAGLLQSVGRLTIEWGRLLGKRLTGLLSNFGRGVGWSLRLRIQVERAAVLDMRRATRAAFHFGLPKLREARVAAHRFAEPTVIVASVLAAVILAGTQWRAPAGMAPIESRPTAFESPLPTLAPTTDRVDARSVQSQRTSAVTSTAAIRRLLNRYRDAYSTLDVSAVRAIWPTVDTNALRIAFDRLAEHNLDYHGCRISVGDARAEAVCRGIAQSQRVGDRTTLTQDRQWHFVLDRVGDRWLIASADPR